MFTKIILSNEYLYFMAKKRLSYYFCEVISMAVIISRFCYAFLGNYGKNNYYCKVDKNCYSYDEMIITIGCDYLKEDFIEIPIVNLSEIIKNFLKLYNVNRYRMKKISDMSDVELRRVYHWHCVENGLTKEWENYENQQLSLIAIKWCEENDVSYTIKNPCNYF